MAFPPSLPLPVTSPCGSRLAPTSAPLSHVLFRSNQSAIWEFIVVVEEEEGRLSIAKDPL